MNSKSSNERKKESEELIQFFDLEYNTNLAYLNKMKGMPIYFESSIFQLLHIDTSKYLALNIDNPNDIQFLISL